MVDVCAETGAGGVQNRRDAVRAARRDPGAELHVSPGLALLRPQRSGVLLRESPPPPPTRVHVGYVIRLRTYTFMSLRRRGRCV